MNDASVHCDGTGGSLSEKVVVPSSDVTSENPNLDTITLEDAGDADIGKIPGETHELRPLLQMLAGSPASKFDLSGNISKIHDEQRENRELLKDLDSPMLALTMRQAFKDGRERTIDHDRSSMGLIKSSFSFMVGTFFGVYVAQNYNVPNIKKLFNTGLVFAKHFEENYRKPKKKRDEDD
ncbi:hypothetical protein TEA_015008 [Camellia sinensis var. sinensis]|uniref:Uncharacterized protein n=2 Tax=Camellia sinensis TaxID=4442 RepID=A0A4S4ELW4_CAMSN|nr:hypothetical protein TEA_015008 [Camellia sinensis var. sinensis]